jgi:hypothetical protein
VGSEEIQTGATVGETLFVGCIPVVEIDDGVTMGTAVEVAATGIPQDETMNALTRNIKNKIFMINRRN